MNPINIQRPQDINQLNKEQIDNYVMFAEKEDYNNMKNVIYDDDGNQRVDLLGKCVVKDLYNGFVDGFIQEQGYNQTEVLDKLSNHMTDYNININNIKVVGQYNKDTQYCKNNVVYYNGDSYFVISSPPIGTIPTNTSYFLKLGLRGDKGVTSLGILSYDIWDESIEYNKYDAVSYNGILYISKTTNVNKIPSANTNDWYEAINYNESIIELSKTVPDYYTNGSLWMETI